jgi:adenylate kinase family enzyme
MDLTASHDTARMRRINVIGTSGAGKTTFARELARRMDLPYVELDSLNWRAGWQEEDRERFADAVRAHAAAEAWVIDGNYRRVRDVIWDRADTFVWLDFPRSVVTWRIVTRSLVRLVRRTELWAGNRETLTKLLSRDSVIWWSIGTYGRHRREYALLLAGDPRRRVVRLRSPAAARRWLTRLPQERSSTAATTPSASASAQKP